MVISVLFERLRKHNCAIVDAMTLEVISRRSVVKFLTDKPDKTQPDWRRTQAEKSHSIGLGMEILARMIVYEFIAADTAAIKSLKIEKPFPPRVIKPVEIPATVYSSAVHEIQQYVMSRVESHDWLKTMKNSTHYFDGDDKIYIDFAHELFGGEAGVGVIANSDDSISRALFYFELGRYADVPVFLSPTKIELLKEMALECRKEAYKIIEKTADEAIRSALKDKIRQIREVSIDCPFPPLVDHIFRKAEVENTSLLKAAEGIRNSPNAADFRKVTWDLQRKLSQGKIDAGKDLDNIAAAVEKMARHFDENYGVKYKTLRLRLAALPKIGQLFEFLGVEEVVLRRPLVKPAPRYVAFIANWLR